MTKKKLSDNLLDLFKVMDQAINVGHWNDLREEAKKDFMHETICRLDGSGYIHKVLKR